MSIQRILSSPTKVQLLRIMSSNATAYSPKDLEEETTKNISVIYDALNELESDNIIKRVNTDGKTRYYRLNKNNSLAKNLKELFEAEAEDHGVEHLPANLQNTIYDAENKLRNNIKDLKIIILFGSVARGNFTPESDIDLYLVVKEKNREKEDQIYDILDDYEKEFSVMLRNIDEFNQEFGENMSELAKSILLEGFTLLYISDNNLKDTILERVDIRNKWAHGLRSNVSKAYESYSDFYLRELDEE